MLLCQDLLDCHCQWESPWVLWVLCHTWAELLAQCLISQETKEGHWHSNKPWASSSSPGGKSFFHRIQVSGDVLQSFKRIDVQYLSKLRVQKSVLSNGHLICPAYSHCRWLLGPSGCPHRDPTEGLKENLSPVCAEGREWWRHHSKEPAENCSLKFSFFISRGRWECWALRVLLHSSSPSQTRATEPGSTGSFVALPAI